MCRTYEVTNWVSTFLFKMVHKVLKFVTKHDRYSSKYSSTFLCPRCVNLWATDNQSDGFINRWTTATVLVIKVPHRLIAYVTLEVFMALHAQIWQTCCKRASSEVSSQLKSLSLSAGASHHLQLQLPGLWIIITDRQRDIQTDRQRTNAGFAFHCICYYIAIFVAHLK